MKTTPKRDRYRHSEGKRWIEVRIKSTNQLFDVRDPAPFRERDLDDDFVEYILSSVREGSVSSPMKFVIYVEEKEDPQLPKDTIREAIRGHFLYQVILEERNLKQYLKKAQIYFLIGFFVLATCLGIAQEMHVPNAPGYWGVLREGIVIFGWVSIWKPIELILFDWYPLVEKYRYYKKIVSTEIDIHFHAEAI